MSTANVAIIAGPTASGKSGLGAKLAQAVSGVVINADSQQLYAALPILTAQPGPALTGMAPHRLYGVVDPTTRVNAAWWADQARAEIAHAQGAGQMPILVGGTGLYLEVLMRGIAAIPDIPASARAEAQADFDAIGRAAFYARLIAADPASRSLNMGDTQRILRAWEVFSATGRPITAWQQDAVGQSDLTFHPFVILPPRDEVRAACDGRFVQMIESGVVGEVESFIRQYGSAVPAARALGFGALASHIKQNASLSESIEQAQAQTRQYAKRQSTWFRNRFKKTTLYRGVFDSADGTVLEKIESYLRTLNQN
jgi:tRNA dimethylallyltransferase